MDLNEIKTNGKWGDAAISINDNFSRTNVEIEKLKNSAIRDKGYFSTEASLKAAWPSPVKGDYAWAGSPYPGTAWGCDTAGTWTDTGIVPQTPSVDSNNWKQTDW